MDFIINPSETNGALAGQVVDEKQPVKAIIPICPYSFAANRRFLKGYLAAISRFCESGLVVVGDYLERTNIAVFDNVSLEDATEKALARGRKISRFVEEAVEQGGLGENLRIISCQEYVESEAFRQIVEELDEYQRNNPEFEKDVLRQTEIMAGNTTRVPGARKPFSKDEIVRLSRYLIEEIALYICLYREGYFVEFYPGRDLFILRQMAEGQYKEFPFEYTKRTHISVQADY